MVSFCFNCVGFEANGLNDERPFEIVLVVWIFPFSVEIKCFLIKGSIASDRKTRNHKCILIQNRP